MSESAWLGLSSQLLPADNQLSAERYKGQAAVLLALSGPPDNPHIILTRRAAHLAQHPSEIAFPGGKWERQDANLVQTALRESFEEVGLAPDQVDVLGCYPQFQTLKGVVVTPVIGVIPCDVHLVPDPAELDLIFTMPLRLLESNQAAAWRSVQQRGKNYRIPVFEYQQHTIWGLTAAIGNRLAMEVFSLSE
ncbi:CoA pyrophosphatase [Gilvimarinus sp. 1_MG-2023]|uniref:CoA pyrophosphatase n=1 Tax=Gilvimarinus sp. 1_MG-2023 TaxID=3062638 RepID=UPI0026E3ACFE|nr:CoA pyrophosphatase [Gilvimarinus sp. 1_MG-2023]MDO6747054.1 CoA pyrophosphatase [Gilvimarinus sp. 1_MG-2023]